MSRTLLLMVGASGAGKSTYANQLSDKVALEGMSVAICSADAYFLKGGEYQFKWEWLRRAHDACQADCEECLKTNIELVIIDNTNLTIRDRKPYELLAEKYGYAVEYKLIGDKKEIKTYAERNVHGITVAKIEKQFAKLDFERAGK